MSNGGSWLPDDDFNGLPENFFDEFNHLDFPLEDIETTNDDGDWDIGFKDLIPPPMEMLTSLTSELDCGGSSAFNGGRVGVKNPETILKQSGSSDVSPTVDNSHPDVKFGKLFQSSSPVSVLDSINGSSVPFPNPTRAQRLGFLVKGIRSKRKRPTSLKFMSLRSFLSGMCHPFASYESDSSEDSTKKKRKKKYKSGQPATFNPEPFNADGTIRKCTHCETTNTPQWREGPNGPKTLCNACGVRYRSGRLVPEYRPASSPTFIPTVHSNMHKRIVEMRRKGEDDDRFDTGR